MKTLGKISEWLFWPPLKAHEKVWEADQKGDAGGFIGWYLIMIVAALPALGLLCAVMWALGLVD